MKKILHISKYYNPYVGGIESVAEEIVNTLKDTNEYEQKVICFGNEKENHINDIEIIRVPYKLTLFAQSISLIYAKKLKNTIREFKPDIILFHAPNPLIALFLLFCHYKGKIVIFHHSDFVGFYRIVQFLTLPIHKRLYKISNSIICTSSIYMENSRELKKYKEKCTCISLYYDNSKTEDYDKRKVEQIKKVYSYPIAMYTGRVETIKGLSIAIKSFNELERIVFLILGSGKDEKKLKRICKNKNIIFLGKKSGKEFCNYLNAADFFIFPSKKESFGLSLVEALAAGKPAIVFKLKLSAVNWINLNGVTGIECKKRNIAMLKDAITKLRDDVELRKKMSFEARKRALDLFSEDTFRANVINFFNNL